MDFIIATAEPLGVRLPLVSSGTEITVEASQSGIEIEGQGWLPPHHRVKFLGLTHAWWPMPNAETVRRNQLAAMGVYEVYDR